MDAVLLARIQFAVTVAYHFIFVPLSIGLGLTMALAERRYYKSGDLKDLAASNMWIKIFTATFAMGVATGITMEFAFGTNWATYSRFVGDIFGAPLAAEALLAFFLESTFLAVLIFGRKRVSPKMMTVSAWLVWAGSLLSALWIIIANSWMQTPAGYKIVGEGASRKAVLTDFFAAALNPSTGPRYFHTVIALIIMGGFVTMAVAAYNFYKKRNLDFAKRTMTVGVIISLVASIVMIPTAHWQAMEVGKQQPSKLAAMEGHWETGPMPMGLIGWVDKNNETTTALEIPGLVSWLVTGDANKALTGLNDIAEEDRPPLEMTYQSYHWMVICFGAIILIVLITGWLNRKKTIQNHPGYLKLLMFMPIIPFLAIQFGWIVAEVGRQPWIVWGELRTVDAVSAVVPAGQILFTLIVFIILYAALLVVWVRVVFGLIKKGPQLPLGYEGQISGKEVE